MKWTPGYDSNDVEDRRGAPAMSAGGLGMLLPLVWRFGWKGVLVAGAIFFLVNRFGGHHSGAPEKAAHDDARAFVGFVTDDTQKTWREIFDKNGHAFVPAHVVLYTEAARTGCGFGDAAAGPFYCPIDQKVYLDVAFFRELHDRFGAPGDFAQAYVIAHELGHHVQNQLGVHLERGSAAGATGMSVRTELQADCYAGIWARSAGDRHLLDVGDIDEAMRAAAAVGDDRLQKQASGTVQPERWTHGSAAERVRWFQRGYQSGALAQCNTFSAPNL